MKKYLLPDFLSGIVNQKTYERWLDRKATTHWKRDCAQKDKMATKKEYKVAIHEAVIESKGKDAYTKENLNWILLSQYNNELSKKLGRAYKKTFAFLPTVDHVRNGKDPTNFKICAWRTNDAKSDLSYEEFLKLCKKVITAVNRGTCGTTKRHHRI